MKLKYALLKFVFLQGLKLSKMDKEQIRKEFNEFLDSASDETVKDFLKFLKDRKAPKPASETDLKNGLSEDDLSFKNRSN